MTESLRGSLSKLLGDNARYLSVREQSKAPRGSFLEGKKNRYDKPPEKGNFGIIPIHRLMVLDVDCHNVADTKNVERTMDVFSEFLCVDLWKTFVIVTQSGGLHVYLMLPDDVSTYDTFPKANLRGFDDIIANYVNDDNFVIDADIRSGATNGYVIAPDSSFGHEMKNRDGSKRTLAYDKYSHWTQNDFWRKVFIAHHANIYDQAILEVPEKGVKRLQQLTPCERNKKNKAATKDQNKKNGEGITAIIENNDGPVRCNVPSSLMKRLEKDLDARDFTTFHAKRAFVKCAISCCLDDEAVADVCSSLDIDRDTASDSKISRNNLVKDISNIEIDQHFHGPWCPSKYRTFHRENDILSSRNTPSVGLQEGLDIKKKKILRNRSSKTKRTWVKPDPVVIDTIKVAQVLQESLKRSKKAKKYVHAMKIMSYFVQPLSNVGTRKIVLSRKDIESKLSLTPSQASEAMRFLRKNDIISVADRQTTGLAATYTVSKDFVEETLTKLLKKTWGKRSSEVGLESCSIFFDQNDGSFKEVATGLKVYRVDSSEDWSKRLKDCCCSEDFIIDGPGAAERYIKREKVERNLLTDITKGRAKVVEMVRHDDRTMTFDVTTGELTTWNNDRIERIVDSMDNRKDFVIAYEDCTTGFVAKARKMYENMDGNDSNKDDEEDLDDLMAFYGALP